jgi:hypothetical protein
LEGRVVLLGLPLICVLLVRLAERRLRLLVPMGEALPLSLELGDAELGVERGGYGVQADVRLEDESI